MRVRLFDDREEVPVILLALSCDVQIAKVNNAQDIPILRKAAPMFAVSALRLLFGTFQVLS
jgi:hypothetical protein